MKSSQAQRAQRGDIVQARILPCLPRLGAPSAPASAAVRSCDESACEAVSELEVSRIRVLSQMVYDMRQDS
jgi:hypothetical protein